MYTRRVSMWLRRVSRQTSIGAFAVSITAVAPVALLGAWLLARHANLSDTDLQMRSFFLIVLPFISSCCISTLLVHRHIYQKPIRRSTTRVASLGAIVLVWPMLILGGSNPTLHGLPMLDERTPSPFTWWVIFASSWGALTLVVGVFYLVAVAIATPIHAEHTQRGE